MKILLINAINKDVEVETRYPNLGLAYLVAAVRNDLPSVEVDFKIIDDEVEVEVGRYKPDLVGITVVSQNFNLAKKYADFVHKRNVPVIIGGIHITLLPKTLPKSCEVGCVGEGEKTFVELIKVLASEGELKKEKLARIKGIVYWQKNKLKRTEPRELEKNLDNLPLPARDLVKIEPHSYMFTSRGCPYRCSFCASSRFWDKLRFFSAEYVVWEIETLVNNYGVKMISFFDDLFVADYSRLVQIYKLLQEKKLIGRVNFTCSCRANLVNKKLVRLLKKMGMVSVGMGLESGNDETLRYLKGGTVSVKDNYRAVRLLKKAQISANASFVIGSPSETSNQVGDTFNFIKKSNLDLFDIYILTPYPGTPVWEEAKKKGLVNEEVGFDWSLLDVNAYRLSDDKIIVISDKLDRKELIGWYRKFRKLRLRHNILRVINHPMSIDLPKLAFGMAKEWVLRYFLGNR